MKYFHDMPSIFCIINNLYCLIYCSYTLHKKLNNNLQIPDWPFVSFWNLKSFSFICSHLLSFVFIRCTRRNHMFSLFVSLVVIFCHPLPFVVNRCPLLPLVICCHSLSLVVPIVVNRCHSLYYSLSFFATVCTNRCYSLSQDVPLVCLFKNNHFIVINWRRKEHFPPVCLSKFSLPKTKDISFWMLYFKLQVWRVFSPTCNPCTDLKSFLPNL